MGHNTSGIWLSHYTKTEKKALLRLLDDKYFLVKNYTGKGLNVWNLMKYPHLLVEVVYVETDYQVEAYQLTAKGIKVATYIKEKCDPISLKSK